MRSGAGRALAEFTAEQLAGVGLGQVGHNSFLFRCELVKIILTGDMRHAEGIGGCGE